MFKVQCSKLTDIGVGSVFIIAAILKLISIDEFEIYIYSFDIFSFLLTTFVSRILIIAEMVLGLFLIFKINYKITRRVTIISLILFTLFLIYVAIFRNDDNCHCFGELVELSPLESIVKNLILIVLLLLSQKPATNSQKPTAKSQKPTAKSLVVLLSCCLVVFILTPPDSIYKMIYSTEKEVSTIDLYESFEEVVKIDFTEEGVEFDTITNFKEREKQLIAVVSAGCKYCKLGLKKLSLMLRNEDIPIEDINVFIWGSPEGIIDFREETMTEDFTYWHIMPNKAIDVTYGRFPIFIMIKEKDIIKTGDFRDLDDAFF